MSFEIRSPQSADEWQAYYHFRWQQLRAPWSQPEGSEKDEWEASGWHIFTLDKSGNVSGCGRLHQVEPGTGQIRYMAVASEQRQRGFGKAILQQLETLARQQGMTRIILHAREHAVGFYTQLGYRTIAASHTMYGSIRHIKMEKCLAE